MNIYTSRKHRRADGKCMSLKIIRPWLYLEPWSRLVAPAHGEALNAAITGLIPGVLHEKEAKVVFLQV